MSYPRKKRTEGFTLVELLVTTIIVSILIAIAHAALRTSIHDAKERKKQIAIQKVEEAKTRYWLDHKTAGPEEIPIAELAPYVQTTTGINAGTNMFYSGPNSLFDGAFNKSEYKYLKPNARGVLPQFYSVRRPRPQT